MRPHHWIRASLSTLCALGLCAVARAQQTKAVIDAPVVVGNTLIQITHLLNLDGDGFQDAIGYWPDEQALLTVSAWQNDGQGALNLVWSSQLDAPDEPLQTPAAVGDFNGDGLDDFAITVDTDIHFFLSNGSNPPTIGLPMLLPARVTNLVAGDFDRDGLDDVAITVGGQLRLYLNRPAGFLPGSSVALPPGNCHMLFTAEVDGDGQTDVALASVTTSTRVNCFPIVGGSLTSGADLFLPSVSDPMPASADIDGDLDEDIVVFGMTVYTVLRRTGPASYTVETPAIGGPATNLVDVDADGDLDGICCGGGGGSGPPLNMIASIFRVSPNSGTGAFATAFEFQGLGARHIAGAADLDHDGDVDLVAGRCVYYADGPLAESPARSLGATVASDRAIADADRDGDPDLDFGLSQVIANSGDGSFVAATPVAPEAPEGLEFIGPGFPGDFDSDGDVDLIVEHGSGGRLLSMRLLRNAGGGSLLDGGPAAGDEVSLRLIPSVPLAVVPLTAEACLAEDVDADGDRDLITRTGHRTASMIWLNDGTGFFTPGQQFPGVYGTHEINFDADQIPDLIGRRDAPIVDRLNVYRGLGAGAFATPDAGDQILSSVSASDRIAVVDIDGDGDPDVGYFLARATIWINDGTGHRERIAHVGASDSAGAPSGFFATDVNRDGLLDVVVYPVGLTPNASRVYPRTGSGSSLDFDLPITLMFVPKAFSDVDGDGDDDAVGARLWQNRRFEGGSAGLRQQYGAGLAGSGGVVPTLGAQGPFRPGVSHEIRLVGGLGGARLVLAVGNAAANEPRRGGTLLVVPNILTRRVRLSGPAGVPGAGEWHAGRAVTSPNYQGRSFYLQGFVVDPGAPERVAFTNGLHLVFGD